MKFGDLCEQYFGSRDLYEIYNIPKQSSQEDVRKAYHKLSLCYHPDRVDEDEKAEATEKFKVLSKIHTILSDPEKRTIYDETGIWTEDNEETSGLENCDWMGYWRSLFNKISIDDIKKYEDQYKGSEEELEDVQRAYLLCRGDMGKILDHIPFVTFEDEDRIRGRINKLLEDGEVPPYDIFFNEPQAKRDRRMRKMRKEAKEAEKELKKMVGNKSNGISEIEKAIKERQQQRGESFFESLERKYAGPKMTAKTKKKSSRGKSSR